jgi:glycosyltransferase involved in cell wall biosynthesis
VTAVRALARVVATQPNVKLIFPGAKHPNPRLANMHTLNRDAQRVAAELGLLDRAVFFGDWVPYADWSNLLLECDVALTLHFETLETRLAYRSRVLEYIWAGLPTVAARGDATAELIERRGLGIVVDCQDVEGVAAAILQLLTEPRDRRAPHFAAARQELTWECAAEPLICFCRAPRPAADRVRGADGQHSYYNPSATEQVRQEREHWEAIIQAYEAGRMMRLLKWINLRREALRQWIAPRPNP